MRYRHPHPHWSGPGGDGEGPYHGSHHGHSPPGGSDSRPGQDGGDSDGVKKSRPAPTRIASSSRSTSRSGSLPGRKKRSKKEKTKKEKQKKKYATTIPATSSPRHVSFSFPPTTIASTATPPSPSFPLSSMGSRGGGHTFSRLFPLPPPPQTAKPFFTYSPPRRPLPPVPYVPPSATKLAAIVAHSHDPNYPYFPLPMPPRPPTPLGTAGGSGSGKPRSTLSTYSHWDPRHPRGLPESNRSNRGGEGGGEFSFPSSSLYPPGRVMDSGIGTGDRSGFGSVLKRKGKNRLKRVGGASSHGNGGMQDEGGGLKQKVDGRWRSLRGSLHPHHGMALPLPSKMPIGTTPPPMGDGEDQSSFATRSSVYREGPLD